MTCDSSPKLFRDIDEPPHPSPVKSTRASSLPSHSSRTKARTGPDPVRRQSGPADTRPRSRPFDEHARRRRASRDSAMAMVRPLSAPVGWKNEPEDEPSRFAATWTFPVDRAGTG